MRIWKTYLDVRPALGLGLAVLAAGMLGGCGASDGAGQRDSTPNATPAVKTQEEKSGSALQRMVARIRKGEPAFEEAPGVPFNHPDKARWMADDKAKSEADLRAELEQVNEELSQLEKTNQGLESGDLRAMQGAGGKRNEFDMSGYDPRR